MQARWAIVGGIAAGIAVAWWLSRDARDAPPTAQGAAGEARAGHAEVVVPVLYRWTDEAGVLQVTQEPPPRGRRYETVDVQPVDGIQVDGRRH